MEMMANWHLNLEAKESKKMHEIISAQAKKLKKTIELCQNDDKKYEAVYTYYRKFYTMTLKKESLRAGINKSPTRDIILDYPWKDLELNRIQCLKIWEKINH